MKHNVFIIVLFFFFSTLLCAQIPNRTWSTYHGGSNEDSFRDMAIDRAGNVYVVGSTSSSNAIAATGSYQSSIAGISDVILAKYDTNGNRVWATYFGGTEGDYGQSIDLDASGNIFITGLTFSSNGIATAGTHQTINNGNGDTFVAKFSNNGNRLWGTYLGGGNFDFANDIEVDVFGNPIIIGWTNSANAISSIGSFQNTYSGQDDVLFAKFNTNGQLQWSTYLGDIGFDTGLQVESDGIGNIVISGWTSSTTNITTTGAVQTNYGGNTADVFLAVFTSTGNKLWATYYGGSGDDYSDALFVSAGGDIYLSGSTTSPNSIASSGAFQPNKGPGFDAFLARFSITGTRLWSTYFGGNGDDTAYRIRAGNDAAVYMIGHTTSTNVMATPAAFQPSKSGGQDVFLTRFENNGTRTWSTYYGDAANDFGYGLVVDANNDIFINGTTEGSTNLSTPGAVQVSYGGGTRDGFVAKFSPCTAPVNINLTSNSPVCAGSPLSLMSNDGVSYQWSGPNGYMSSLQNPLITNASNQNAGSYEVTVTTASGCTATSSLSVIVNPIPTITSTSNTPVCIGNTVNLMASGGVTYQWSGPNGYISVTQNPSISNASPLNAGTYRVTVTNTIGCTAAQTTIVEIRSNPISIVSSNSPVCDGGDISFQLSGGVSYQWQGPNNFSSTAQNPTISNAGIANNGTYIVTVTGQNSCTATASTLVNVSGQLNASVSSNSPVCLGDTLRLIAAGGTTYVWNGPNGFNSTSQNPVITSTSSNLNGNYILTVSDVSGCRGTRQINVVIKQKPMAVITGDRQVCVGEKVTLQSPSPGSLLWSTGDASTSIVVSPSMTTSYTLTADLNGCKDLTSFIVTVKPAPNITIDPTAATIKKGESVRLSASLADTYQWSPPEGLSCTDCSNPVATPASTTRYCISVEQNDCVADTCININVKDDCQLVFPNIFSPNNDGVNDTWCSKMQDCISSQSLSIYDRWGNLLYNSSGTEVCWDGSDIHTNNVFTYLLQITKSDGKEENMTGTITLMK